MPVSEKRLLEHAEYLRRLVRGLVLDQNRVDDVVQETYLRALSRPPRHSQNLRGWLATVARNVAFRLQRDSSRRARREERAGRPDREPSTSDVAARVEAQKRIADAVNELEEPYRTVIVHRYLDGLAPAEIARRLDVPLKTVKTRLHRGLERLRARLDREYGDRTRWSLLLLPLALPKTGAAVATGVTVLTMKKIIAALLVLSALVFWAVNRVEQGALEPTASRAAATGAEQAKTRPVQPVAQEPDASSEQPLNAAAKFVFSGRVVDTKGDGVPGANVRLVYWGSPKADTYPWGGDKRLRRERERVEDPRVVADTGGYFRFERPYGSQSYLLVESDGFGSTIAGPFEPKEDLNVVLDSERWFHVHVRDPDGEPVADALVRMISTAPEHSYTSRTAIAQGRTDAAGEISLPHMGAKSVILEVAPREPDLGFVDVGLSGKTSATVTLPRLKTRTHRVVDADTGRPLTDAYALVEWSGYATRSVAQELGRRRIDADAGGVIRFPLQKDYYGNVVTAPGYEVTNLVDDVVKLQRSMRVDGRVLDVRGDPVKGAAILIASPQGPGSRCFAGLPLVAAWSDADGRFEAEIKLLWPTSGMPDPGVRSILAIDKRRGCAIEDSLTVKPGTRSSVTLRFPRPAKLTIEIVGPDGAPRPDHWINVLRRVPAAETWVAAKMPHAFGANPPWLLGQRPVTDEHGRAVIDRLPPGEYDIHLKFHRRKLTLEAGEVKVLRVVRGAGPSIFGRLLDESGEPQAQVRVALQGSTNAFESTDLDGRFKFEDVKPGDHRVGFHSRRANAWVSVPAVVNQEVTLREPKELASIRLTVEGPAAGTAEFCYVTSKGSGFPPGGFWKFNSPAHESMTFVPSKGILIVRAPGYSWKVVAFDAQAGEPTAVHVAMPKAGSVKGTADAELVGENKHVYLFLKRSDGHPQRLAEGDQNLTYGLGGRLGDARFSAKLVERRFQIPNVAPGVYWATLYRYVGRQWQVLAPPREIEVRSDQVLDLTFAR